MNTHSPLTKQLSVNGWIVELKNLSNNYPKLPPHNVSRLSVERIVAARRAVEKYIGREINNALQLKLREVGLTT